MATEDQKTILDENASEVPSDHELFAGQAPKEEPKADENKSALEIHEELSEREVFAGDEDFYKRLADSLQDTASQSRHAVTDTGQPLPAPIKHKRFSTVQKILVASIAVIGAMLLYALLKSSSGPVAGPTPTPAGHITPDVQQAARHPELPAEDFARVPSQQVQKPSRTNQLDAGTPMQPLSLKIAQDFYLQKDYDRAYAAYDQLYQNLPASPEEELMRDFFQLKMALCIKKANRTDQADRLLGMVSKSRSPVVGAVANYHRSLLEMQKKQYLKARTRAYQTIALLGAIDFDRHWALSLERDCHLLVAESMTRNVLSLCDADKDLPEDLWSTGSQIDPFANLSETRLRFFLNSGSEQLSKGQLAPKVQKFQHQSISPAQPRWSVVCHGPSIEELLARFAANAGFDIHWACKTEPHPTQNIRFKVQNSKWDPRKRPVSVYLPAATAVQFVSTAAGRVGLLARLDNKTVTIFNPADYSSLSEHISLLTREAISLWQRFILTFPSDERIPNAHFALGLLQAQKGQVAESIAEYKLVANRFSQASLAPFALLHSSKLKTGLRDYPGAREDLKQLVEQYPDTDIASRSRLYLADATMETGSLHEAQRLYRKVYNLGSSLELQTAAALGAAKCFYEEKDYQAAIKWLTRYISLAKDRTDKDLYSAYFLLGKTNLALGKFQQACDAFQYALRGQLAKEEYLETVLALVETQIQQKHFVEALDTLESIPSLPFSQEESTETLLLKSRILRTMGLVDKAIMALGDRAQYIFDPQLKAKISFELTKGHIAKEDWELARRDLTEILLIVEPGPLAHEAACELADVCLKLGQNSQTISICLQLLDLAPSMQIKQKALKILAATYSRQKNYDKAALALLGQWNGAEAPKKKQHVDGPAATEQSQSEP